MNRAEMVEHLAKATKLTKAASSKALDAMLEGITRTLKKGQTVGFVGFGSFVVRSRKARTGRNPRTGAAIKIKAAKTVGFRVGKSLKETVNK